MQVVVATCAEFPALPPDELRLVRAIGDRATVVPWVWTDGDIPDDTDLCILRATWDSHLDPDAYLTWLRRTNAQTKLVNSRALVEWNFHKRYLCELADRGVPVVATEMVKRGRESAVEDALARCGAGPMVVKPAISASAYQTRRFTSQEVAAGDAAAFARTLVAQRDILIQPLRPEVFTTSERSAIYIDGNFSHVSKRLPFGTRTPDRAPDEPAIVLSKEEEAFCDIVLAALPETPLYARIDYINDLGSGKPLLMEAELIDPSLFFQHRPAAATQLADAVIAAAAVQSTKAVK